MRLSLQLHSNSICRAAAGIAVAVTRARGFLVLHFRGEGGAGLIVPPAAAPERTDGLWQHTCFEAFIRPPGEGYCEFNFSPSGQWAAYRFASYRAGMAAHAMPPPQMTWALTEAGFELLARFSPGLADDAPWRLGLAAVIEEAGSGLFYWALRHPPGKPDFHHAGCFAHELAAP
jgi:hypothetical protein